MDTRIFGLTNEYSVVVFSAGGYRQLSQEEPLPPRDIGIFEAKTVPPAPGRYRQAG